MNRVRWSSVMAYCAGAARCHDAAFAHVAAAAALQGLPAQALVTSIPYRCIWNTCQARHDHQHHLSEAEQACWSCNQYLKRGGLVCNSCDKIQPINTSLTYYEVLGLPQQTFEVDVAQLERRYKLLQWTLHPDKAISKDESERELSAQAATLVNRAYSVLKSPLSRANYLLAQQGVEAGDSFEGTISDPELLMEVMEAREEVEATDDKEKLHLLRQANQRQQDDLVGQLAQAFAAGDAERAVQLTTHLTYFVKLGQAILDKI